MEVGTVSAGAWRCHRVVTRGGPRHARVLGRHGASGGLSSRSAADVKAAVERLRTEGIDAYGRQCDMAEFAEVEALRDEALRHGALDIWVNNAGSSGVYGPTAFTPVEDFARVVRTNILGTFHGSRVALPVFLGQGDGDLVNVYGQGDQRPVALQNAYASSKRWVRQFTETLRAETKNTGVRVHGMNPGLVVTDMLGSVTSQWGYEQRLGGCRWSSASGVRPRRSPHNPSYASPPPTSPSSATSRRRRRWDEAYGTCWQAASAAATACR